MMFEVSWDITDTERLKELWAAGNTASQIATLMGNKYSRSAIISKANRLHLAPRAAYGTGAYSHRTKPQISKPPFRAPAIKEKTEATDLAHPSNEPEPIGPINDFPRRGCRWISGDVRSGDWRCCGASGDPWCPHHAARALTKPYVVRP